MSFECLKTDKAFKTAQTQIGKRFWSCAYSYSFINQMQASFMTIINIQTFFLSKKQNLLISYFTD